MSPRLQELTHCSAHCGVNFHFEFLEEWKRTRTAPSPAKCPLCRREWKEVSLARQNLSNITEHNFELYIEWLYRKRILTAYDEEDDEIGDRYEELVEAYKIGEHFEDKGFCSAVLHAIIEACADTYSYPSWPVVETAYKQTSGPCSLRNLLVEIYTKLGLCEDTESALSNGSTDFLRDLSAALLKKVPVDSGDWSLAHLKGVQTLQPIDDTEDDEYEKHDEDKSSSSRDRGHLQCEEEEI
jgi:hypothetical protein